MAAADRAFASALVAVVAIGARGTFVPSAVHAGKVGEDAGVVLEHPVEGLTGSHGQKLFCTEPDPPVIFLLGTVHVEGGRGTATVPVAVLPLLARRGRDRGIGGRRAGVVVPAEGGSVVKDVVHVHDLAPALLGFELPAVLAVNEQQVPAETATADLGHEDDDIRRGARGGGGMYNTADVLRKGLTD